MQLRVSKFALVPRDTEIPTRIGEVGLVALGLVRDVFGRVLHCEGCGSTGCF